MEQDVETRFDTSNYKPIGPLPKGINQKVIGLMEDELRGKTMTNFFGLRAKTYTYLKDDGSDNKQQKTQKSLS